MKFTKEDLENLKVLADHLVQVVELEPDEVKTMNKFYAFLSEEELKV